MTYSNDACVREGCGHPFSDHKVNPRPPATQQEVIDRTYAQFVCTQCGCEHPISEETKALLVLMGEWGQR